MKLHKAPALIQGLYAISTRFMNRNAAVKIDLNSQYKGEEKLVCLQVTFARQLWQVALV